MGVDKWEEYGSQMEQRDYEDLGTFILGHVSEIMADVIYQKMAGKFF